MTALINKILPSNSNVQNTKKSTKEINDILSALNDSLAMIEFNMDGTIITANKNFLSAMGYSLDEIKRKHHSMFVGAEYAKSQEYKDFWARLNEGHFFASQYKRLGKGNKEIWIEASYNPIKDKKGNPYKVVKFASDITDRIKDATVKDNIYKAINRSQAAIFFNMDGTIMDANENFLSVMGYSLEEIKGKHHSMFAEPDYAQSQEYKDFWASLNKGEYQAAQYKRLGKDGREVWIEASYNPVFDVSGKPFQVVKFATDLTPRKNQNKKLATGFEDTVGKLVQTVAVSASQMESVSQNLASSVEETGRQYTAVATAAEELSASVKEISDQVVNSNKIIKEAVEETKKSEHLVSSLVDAAQKIGEVTELISNIAEQTNLLALNATIEAARAGDAGKGFAVVATEVKKLAQETAQATEKISAQVGDIQEISNTTAVSINNITQTIDRVSEISSIILKAVEAQSIATQEVASNITKSQVNSESTAVSAKTVSEVSGDLSNKSEELKRNVDDFLIVVNQM